MSTDGSLQSFCWIQNERRIPPKSLKQVLMRAAKRRHAEDPDGDGPAFYLKMAEAMDSAEVFEFGHMPDDAFRDQAKRGGALLAAKLLDTPYQTCVFWTDYAMPNENGGEVLRFCTMVHRLDVPGFEDNYLVLDAAALPPDVVEDATGQPYKPGNLVFAMVGFGLVQAEGDDSWSGKEIEVTRLCVPEKKIERLSALADTVAGLSMIIATKGIPLRREVPSARLQQKRAKAGKEPLPIITYVDTQRWLDARNNSERRGTHASPVPHLRRGHIRTYPDGRRVWIRDMLVNTRNYADIAPARDHYQVLMRSAVKP